MSVPVNVQSDGSFAGFTPGSLAVAGGNYGVAQAGDVSISMAIASSLTYTSVISLDGSVVVNTSINTAFNKIKTLVGSILIQPQIDGNIQKLSVAGILLELIPASITTYAEVRLFSGAISLSLSANAGFDFENYERIAPSPINIVSASIDETIDSDSGGINPTTDNNTGSIGETPLWP